MFGYKLIRTKLLDEELAKYNALSQRCGLLETKLANSDDIITILKDDLTKARRNVYVQVESALKNHDRVIGVTETDEARFSLIRKCIALLSPETLASVRAFVAKKSKSANNSQKGKDNPPTQDGSKVANVPL